MKFLSEDGLQVLLTNLKSLFSKYVKTSGNQTIAGNKHFTGQIEMDVLAVDQLAIDQLNVSLVVAQEAQVMNFIGGGGVKVASAHDENLTLELDLDANNKKITKLANPSDPTDAVNKQYVDSKDSISMTETFIYTGNSTFTLQHEPSSFTSPITILRGNDYFIPNAEYTLSGKALTIVTPLISGDVISVFYLHATPNINNANNAANLGGVPAQNFVQEAKLANWVTFYSKNMLGDAEGAGYIAAKSAVHVTPPQPISDLRLYGGALDDAMKHAFFVSCPVGLQIRDYSGTISYNLTDIFPNIDPSTYEWINFTVVQEEMQFITVRGAGVTIRLPTGADIDWYLYNPDTLRAEAIIIYSLLGMVAGGVV